MIALILGILLSGGGGAAIWFFAKQSSGSGEKISAALNDELSKREQIVADYKELYTTVIDVPAFQTRVQGLRSAQEALKAERGRITITQAELETVETRLRELDEIERELEASGVEAKEEAAVLEKKQADILKRNQMLRSQLENSNLQLGDLLSQVQLSAEMQAQVQEVQDQLLRTQTKIEELSTNIEQCNEQYFVLKRRYDALDIEYAQLYEKFSETEAAMGAARNA